MEMPEIAVRDLACEHTPAGAGDEALVIEAVDPPARRRKSREERAQSGGESESEIAPSGRDGARQVRQAEKNTASRGV